MKHVFISFSFSEKFCGGELRRAFGANDVILLKTDKTLNVLAEKHLLGLGTETATALSYTADSCLVYMGEFENRMYFNNDSLVSNGNTDIALIKFDQRLNSVEWSRNLGNANNDIALFFAGCLRNCSAERPAPSDYVAKLMPCFTEKSIIFATRNIQRTRANEPKENKFRKRQHVVANRRFCLQHPRRTHGY